MWINPEIWQKALRWNKYMELRRLRNYAIILLFAVYGASCIWPAPDATKDLKTKSESKAVRKEVPPQVVLIIAYSWSDEKAMSDLEQAFTFAIHKVNPEQPVAVVHAGSPLEIAAACDTLMDSLGVRLLFFAGDEGAALSATLIADRHQMPLIKLSSDSRPMIAYGKTLYEFLPSAKTQAEVLAVYAAEHMNVKSAMMLTEQDARGRANAEGFRAGMLEVKCVLDAARDYPVDAPSIRGPLAELFANSERIARGERPLTAAINFGEKSEMFGDSTRGEALLTGAAIDSMRRDTINGREGLFFALTTDKAGVYMTQLPPLPKNVALFGNSGWLDSDILGKQSSVTNGMHIVAPLNPDGTDSSELQTAYETVKKTDVSEWDLLGLDAGTYAAKLLTHKLHSRPDIFKALDSESKFQGCAIAVDFAGSRENRAAQLFKFDEGKLNTIVVDKRK
jgi:hypothetical protein